MSILSLNPILFKFDTHFSGWTRLFPEQKEILEYAQKVGTKYELYRHASFNTNIESARWIPEDSEWELKGLRKNSGTAFTERFQFVYDN